MKRLAIAALFFSLASATFAQTEPGGLAEGRAFVEAGDFEGAQYVLEEVVKEHPESAEAHYLLGAAYGIEAQSAGRFRQMRLAGKIKSQFERAVELDPSHFGAREGLIQFHLQAPRVAGGREEVAQEHAEAMMQIDPQRGWPFLGAVLAARDNLGDAAAVYRDGAASAEATFEARAPAVYFFQQHQRYADALVILRPLAEAGDWSARYQIGRTAAFAGDYLEEGAAHLEAYLTEHAPAEGQAGHHHAHHRLGQIRAHQGREGEARAAYEAALALAPDFAAAREALALLDD
jgi:tetratricopeptide (TPR) repeat protein